MKTISKKSFLIFIGYTSLIFTLFLTYPALSTLPEVSGINDDLLDDEKIRGIQKIITEQREVCESSNGKEVVVVMGGTGAGKSTLINLLAGALLEIDYDGHLVPVDQRSALPVGDGFQSVTRVPQHVFIDGIGIVYDLPGFEDTDGAMADVLNAAFIRRILTGARSVKVVFVTSQAEIESCRGPAFKHLIQAMKMFDNSFVKKSSLLIVNKMEKELIDSDRVMSTFRGFDSDRSSASDFDNSPLKVLIEGNRVFFVKKSRIGDKSEMFLPIRCSLIEKIKKDISPSRVFNPKISMTFNSSTAQSIGLFFYKLMETFLERKKETLYGSCLDDITTCQVGSQRRSVSDILSGEMTRGRVWKKFKELLKKEDAVILLSPIGGSLYEITLDSFKERFFQNYELYVQSQKFLEMQEKTQKIEEERLAAEAARSAAQRQIEKARTESIRLEAARKKAEEDAARASSEAVMARKDSAMNEARRRQAVESAERAYNEKQLLEAEIKKHRDYSAQLSQLQQQTDYTIQQLEREKAQASLAQSQAHAQSRSYAQKLQEKEREMSSLRSSLSSLQSQQSRELSDMRSTVSRLESELRSRSSQSEEISRLRSALSSSQERVQELENFIRQRMQQPQMMMHPAFGNGFFYM